MFSSQGYPSDLYQRLRCSNIFLNLVSSCETDVGVVLNVQQMRCFGSLNTQSQVETHGYYSVELGQDRLTVYVNAF